MIQEIATDVRGVYIIYLKDSRYVYCGQSGRIAPRYDKHLRDWLWPNEHMVEVIEMRGSSRAEREFREGLEHDRLRKEGYTLLSMTSDEARAMRLAKADQDKANKRRRTTRLLRHGPSGISKQAMEAGKSGKFSEAAKKSWETRRARFGPSGEKSTAQRSEEAKARWERLSRQPDWSEAFSKAVREGMAKRKLLKDKKAA